jgi:predicted MPP superfamily phosphohydrolase
LAIALLVTIASLVTYCFGVEPFRLEITHYEVQSSKVEDEITIAVLADFQTDKFKEYQRASLLRLMQEKPDVIVLAGDYLQSRTQQGWEQLRDQMRAYLCEIDFAAPQGVYAVGGNTDFRRWPEIFLGRNVEIFTASRTIESEAFVITGLAVEDSFATDLTIPEVSSKLHIVLGHAPDFSLSPGINADLLIAGHTHGGQVRLPWIGPLVTFSQVPRAWAAGLTRLAPERTLVVSRGVGMERRDAPRLRFLCRPQLVFIHLVPNERSLGTKRCLRKVSI